MIRGAWPLASAWVNGRLRAMPQRRDAGTVDLGGKAGVRNPLLDPLCGRRRYTELCRSSYVEYQSRDESQLCEIAKRLAKEAKDGDTYFLIGDLGAGKTSFARGFLQAYMEDPGLVVTSPTFLLTNVYERRKLGNKILQNVNDVRHKHPSEDKLYCEQDGGRRKESVSVVHHVDLYRLQPGEDISALDLERAMATDICLIEWPDRLGKNMPLRRLEITIEEVNGHEASGEAAPVLLQRCGETKQIFSPQVPTVLEDSDAGFDVGEMRVVRITPVGGGWDNRWPFDASRV